MKKFKRPVKGKITSPFGNRLHPINGVQSFHNGIDISAKTGTEVLAPDAGKVTEYWDHAKGGKCLAITNKDGVRFGFAHLHFRYAQLHQDVKAGEVIALVGNTGASTGPHLHFTIKINGQWVNPEDHI